MRHAPALATLTSIALVLALSPRLAHADPKRTPGVTCTSGGLSSPPKFTQLSPGRAEYNFSGVCITREGESIGYRIDGTWTPSEAGSNANASEVYRVDRLSGRSESFTALVGWRCNADPWLHDTHCDRIGDNIPDEPYAFWEEFGRGTMPSSRRALSGAKRKALLADYERANGGRLAATMNDHLSVDAAAVGVAQPATGTTRDPVRKNTLGDEASLNPQPLPPEPDPDPKAAVKATTTPAASKHVETSIIIVGGKPAASMKGKIVKKAGGG